MTKSVVRCNSSRSARSRSFWAPVLEAVDGEASGGEGCPESVFYVVAIPKLGWTWDLDYEGPEQVEVSFERFRDDYEIDFTAKFKDGELEITISED